MPIMLPLTLLGIGYLISQLLAGATLALPIAIGVGTGLSAHQLGASPLLAGAFGMLAFMMTIAASRFAALSMVNPYARVGLALVYGLPAALAGYSVGHALGWLTLGTGTAIGIVGGALCAGIAVHRIARPAI